jgi:hypothetical protein
VVKKETIVKGYLGFYPPLLSIAGFHNDEQGVTSRKCFIDLMPVAGREIHRRVHPWAYLPVFL